MLCFYVPVHAGDILYYVASWTHLISLNSINPVQVELSYIHVHEQPQECTINKGVTYNTQNDVYVGGDMWVTLRYGMIRYIHSYHIQLSILFFPLNFRL